MKNTRRVRLALAIGLVVVVIAIVLGWRRPPASRENERSGLPGVAGRGEMVKGGESIVLSGDREAQRVKAAWSVTEPDGTTRFRGDESGPVQVTMGYTADGQRDKVTIEAARAEYHPTTQSGRFEGAVRVATGLGVELTTDTLTYRGQDGIAETDDVVTFKRKQVAGSARGVRMAIREGRLTLGAEVKVHVDDEQRGPVEIEAARGAFEKQDGGFELLGGVTVRQGESLLTADRLTGKIELPGYVLRLIEANGNVILVSSGAAMGREMGLNATSGSYKLRAARLDMPIGAEGARRELHVGPGGFDFVWRSGPQGVEKRLEANAGTFVLDAAGRIESAYANKNVRLTQGTGPSADLVSCGTGFVSLDPQSREITRGELDRDVVMTRGASRAAADHGLLQQSELLLTGSPEVGNSETGARLSGDNIRIGTGQKRGWLAAWGDVTHSFRRWRRGDRAEAGLMTVKANDMEYDEKKYSGVYNGEVLLRMGDDEISARQILVRGNEKNLRLYAYYRVVSRFAVQKKGGSTAAPVEGRARALKYSDAEGVLSYEGDVVFRQGDVGIETPDTLVLHLGADRTLTGITAGGTRVTLAMGARRATGTSLAYSAKDEAFRLLGDPVAYDDGGGSAGRGLALTLFQAEDRIQIDGRDLQRTVTTIKRGPSQK